MVDRPVIRKTCKRYNIPGNAHELTFSCFRRRAFLSKDRTREYFIQAVAQARGKHPFDLWAYVIMPEHVHLLIWPRAEDYSISDFLYSIKYSVSRRAMLYLRRYNPAGLRWLATGLRSPAYSFWLEGGGYDRNIHTDKTLWKVVEYIHLNPVRRRLVDRPEDWPWSSYRDLHGLGTGPIPIDRESLIRAIS